MRFSMLFALSLFAIATTGCSGADTPQEGQPSSAQGGNPPAAPETHPSAAGSAAGAQAAPLTDEELDRMLDALEQEIDKK